MGEQLKGDAGKLASEFVGSFMLGLFGLMTVAVAVTTGGLNMFEVVFLFGLVVGFAIYVAGGIGGGHFNPAVTITMAVYRKFPLKLVIPYIITQIAGWAAGAGVLYLISSSLIENAEAASGIVRGTIASQATAMIFNCYAPHPGFASFWGGAMTAELAVFVEVLATFSLIFPVLVMTDEKNPLRPSGSFLSFIVGMIVAFTMGVFSPYTMSCINPARDFGPRIITFLAGWGEASFPGPPSGQGGPFWIYWVGPIIGGLLAGAVYKFLIEPYYPKPK